MTRTRLPSLVAILFLAIVLLAALVLALRPPTDNLLSIDRISDAHGVLREQRLFDGKLPAPATEINDFSASLLLAKDAFIRFDLGEGASFEYVQLDSFLGGLGLWVSTDNESWRPLALKTTRANGSAIGYFAATSATQARYLKLAPLAATGRGAAYELTVLPKIPPRMPLVYESQDPPTYDDAVEQELQRLSLVRLTKIGIAIVFAVVFLLGGTRRAMVQLCVYSFFFVLAMCAWFLFSNPLQHPHTWDATHYYLGAKYIEELGHTELYNEIARHELRSGRGQLFVSGEFRDLSTYELHPGRVVLSPQFNSQSSLSHSRQVQFSTDADRIRRLFRYRHFSKIVRDHGYNAAPLFTTIFGGLLQAVPPSRTVLTVFALADILFVLGGLAAIWLAFGARSACLAALVLGIGEPWAFTWTGGSIGRFVWFFLLCGGLALIKRKRAFSGAVCLSLAGLLRLFPLVFLAGMGGVALYRWFNREERKRQIPFLLGSVAALAIGLALPALIYSTSIYGDFLANTRLHAQNVSFNRIGFGALLDSWSPERHPLANWASYSLGLVGCLVLCAKIVKSRLELWHAFFASGLLLYFVSPLSSYDYVWLVCLAPACVTSQFRTLLLALMLVAFNVFTEFPLGHPPEILMNVVASAGLALFFGSYGYQLFRHPQSLELDSAGGVS